MGLLDKLKTKIGSKEDAGGGESIQVPTQTDEPTQNLLRYRRQRGVNLGAWFSSERWIAEQPFTRAAGPGQSDMDIAKGEKPTQPLEDHWNSWITETDWDWVVSRGFNTVRLPVGYYHLFSLDPNILNGTPFEPHGQTFAGAWAKIEAAIQTAGNKGLGILVDLHGVAGCQNGDAHSGMSDGKVYFWDKKEYQNSTSLALKSLASYLCRIPHVVGLELMNEPANNDKLEGWYTKTIKEVQQVAGMGFPLYIGDAWDTAHYRQFAATQPGFIVVDHHLYRCFTPEDASKHASEHARDLSERFSFPDANAPLVVGEFSAALNPGSFNGAQNDGERDALKREFLIAQLDLYERKCAGYFFWTLKKGDGWDNGWSAMDAARSEVLPPKLGRARKPDGQANEQEGRDALKRAYGSTFEHDRFQSGLEQGWNDARMFHQQGEGWELGFVEPWRKWRLEQHRRERGASKSEWEFEHGFSAGVDIANQTLLQ